MLISLLLELAGWLATTEERKKERERGKKEREERKKERERKKEGTQVVTYEMSFDARQKHKGGERDL